MDKEGIFKKFLEEIEPQFSSPSYTLWFGSLELISMVDNKLTIKVPLQIHKITLNKSPYKSIIDNALLNVTGKTFEIEYLTQEELPVENVSSQQVINNDVEMLSEEWDTHLNPNLTFENFMVGDSNKLAYVSAKAVAEHPGTINNPLFIYGRSGIGKTHLMHAIGNYIVKNSNKRVLYTRSDDFRSDYIGITSIEKGIEKSNYAKSFRNKYQNIDVLIIDDIQFLVGADKTQQEFFHIFNSLYQDNKQIIISSDSSPDDLQKIEDRLKSRFMWGLPVDIFPPDFKLRCKIIHNMIKNSSFENMIGEEIIEFIANACPNDVRFLNGTLNKFMAYTAMMLPSKIDINFVQEAIHDYISKNVYSDNSIDKIQKKVADYFNISVNDLKNKRKTEVVAKARHIAIYLCRTETEETLAKIGLSFGGRDHSTMSASYDKVKDDMKNNGELKHDVEEIKKLL